MRGEADDAVEPGPDASDAYPAVLEWLRSDPADHPRGAVAMLIGLPDHWLVVPVDARSKRPLVREWTRPGVARPLADREQIERWLGKPGVALAVLCGEASDLLVVDVDVAGSTHATDGMAALCELEARLGSLPVTVESRTPSGGRHVWLAWPEGRRRIASKPIVPGVDVRGTGSLAILPLAGRAPGRSWIRHPAEHPLATLPPRWLAKLLPVPPVPVRHPLVITTSGDAYGRKALEGLLADVRAATPGVRNATLARSAWRACHLIRAGRLDLFALDHLAEAGRAVGLDRTEVHATIIGAVRKACIGWRSAK